MALPCPVSLQVTDTIQFTIFVMEPLTILLSTLIGLISPSGLVLDRVVENTIRSRFVSVESLKVRVDNVPVHQILKGQIDRLRIAGRGMSPIKDVRIDVLDLETDPIVLQGLTPKLKQPLQAGVRIVLKPEDINQGLRSPLIATRLRNLGFQFLQRREAQQLQRFDFLNPKVEFLPDRRVRLQAELQEQGYPDKLTIVAEAEPSIESGRTLRLLNPTLLINGKPAPAQITRAIAQGVSNQLDLSRLGNGITARVLKLEVDPAQIQMTAFVQIRPHQK